MAVISNNESTQSMEQQGALVGTLAYMAPEQIDPGVDDERSDIYSLGAVLYVMATGQRPFGHSAAVRLIDAILHQQPVPPRTQNPGLAPELERIILKCIDKNPYARYQSAREIAIELKTLLPQGALGPSDSRTIPEDKGRQYKRLLVPGVIAAAFVIVVTGFLFYRAVSTRNARTGHKVQRSNATHEGNSGDVSASDRGAGGTSIHLREGSTAKRPSQAGKLTKANRFNPHRT
jgi:serine/threonine protein kinase